MRNRSKILPVVFALPFVVAACGDDASPSEETTETVTSTATSVEHEEEGATHSDNEQPHHNEGVIRDDDPGGQPCTDQNGAPGHYIATDEGSFVCEITGDAPRQ